MDDSTISRVQETADRLHESALHALTQLIFDAQQTLKDLQERQLRTTVGGSVLNHQLFMDAERYLTTWKLAADISVWLATEIGLESDKANNIDLLIVNMQDDGWLCSDASGQLWWFPTPQFYTNLTLGHDDHDDPGMIEPGQNIRVKRADVTRMDGSEVHEVLN